MEWSFIYGDKVTTYYTTTFISPLYKCLSPWTETSGMPSLRDSTRGTFEALCAFGLDEFFF
ncbi:hypothetical protein F2Q69_00037468 [Brassica cretica]|uniref:Uncharacterized protein n=1 Tax=Brassica cretica TaxID=69181 RepID=A0A8S9SIF1_BRACR|nr:hypothetical protein F2Q69_00037468 [Brassica cretica]